MCPFRNGNCWKAKCKFWSEFNDECVIVATLYYLMDAKKPNASVEK